MIKFEIEPGNLRLMGFLGKTFLDNNLDQSDDVATQQDRCFWGFQAEYLGFDRHIPFAYFLASNDHASPKPRTAGQDYDYTSRYVGVGSQGTVLNPNLRYRVEAVGEWGKTYSRGEVIDQDDICAFGADAMLEYYFAETPMRPKLMVEWLFGSGDDDRLNSSTNTVGGNRPGTNDNAFNAFGFRDTGLAFAPNVSNMHIYIVGASFYPLENLKLFKDMQIGTKALFYHKDKSGGPISDTSANTTEQWVGWEWDVYCDWRITSDFSLTVRYGAFQPGSAFEDQECRQFFFTGLNYSF